MARSVLAEELRMYEADRREEREEEEERARERIASELRIAQTEVAGIRAESARAAEQIEKRASQMKAARSAEVDGVLAAEKEKTERLRRFNEMARSLMREELRILDAEERQDYKDALDEEMAAQRLGRINSMPSAPRPHSGGANGRIPRVRRARSSAGGERSSSRSPLRARASESAAALARAFSPLRSRRVSAPSRAAPVAVAIPEEPASVT